MKVLRIPNRRNLGYAIRWSAKAYQFFAMETETLTFSDTEVYNFLLTVFPFIKFVRRFTTGKMIKDSYHNLLLET